MTVTSQNLNPLLEAVRIFAWENLNCRNITEAEDQIQEITRAISKAMMSEVAGKISGKPTYKGARISCDCGMEAKFIGYRKRLHGDIEVKRACYRCSECKRGYITWDSEQGLDERVWTPRIKELVASVCGDLTYEAAKASDLRDRTQTQ